MPVVVIDRGKDKGRTFKLPDRGAVPIGRDKSCAIRIADVMASRRHCEIVTQGSGGRVLVRDLGSSNGTFVNGARLLPESPPRPVAIEDKIQVGSTLLSLLPDPVDSGAKPGGELSGRVLGGYRVEERIGRGAMGTVYKAVQLSLDRAVALKILARELTDDRRRVEMFLSEARAAGKLNHPNIVQVYDVGEDEGVYFYSMEFIEGGSVEDLLHRDGRIALGRAIPIVRDAARGLEYAERQKIVHRDVKPGNLMMNAEGVTKIGDLGIARRLGPPPPLPQGEGRGEGVPKGEREEGGEALPDLADLPDGFVESAAETEGIAGSPLYIAPEQAIGRAVDHRADLYSLGATFFHMVAGAPPFEGASPREVILKHLKDAPPRLDAVDLRIPRDVADLVARLLEKDPAKRPASAAAVLKDLQALEARYPPAWVPSASAERRAAGLPTGASGAAGRFFRALFGTWRRAAATAAFLVAVGGGIATERVLSARAQREADEAARREADEENARLAAVEATARARAARVREAETALAEADGFVAANPRDLLAGQERFEGVAARFADIPAVAEGAKERARKLADTFAAAQAEERRTREAREKRESEAKAAFAALEGKIAAAAPALLQALRADLDLVAGRHAGTEAAEKEPARLRAVILSRLDQALKEAEADATGRIANGAFAEARAIIDDVASWAVPEIGPWVEALRSRIDSEEQAAQASAVAAAEADRLADEEALARTDDRAARRALRYPEVRLALEALRGSVRTEAVRARLDERIFALRAQEEMRERLVAHVNQGGEPRVTVTIGDGREGIAFKADGSGLTFQDRGKKVEVGRKYASFPVEDLARFFSLLALTPKDRYALAWLFRDFEEDDRARSEATRARRELTRGGAGAGTGAGDDAAELLKHLDRFLAE